jgi:hypothetical protein
MDGSRSRVFDIISRIDPFDALELEHKEEALAWVRSGAPLFRIAKPDKPPQHLVSYFLPCDEWTDEPTIRKLARGYRPVAMLNSTKIPA